MAARANHSRAASPAPVQPRPSLSCPDDFSRIGVGRPEPRHDAGLERLHALRLRVRLVIVADKMEKSMRDEMAIVVGERNAELVRLARQRLISQGDIAEGDGFRETAGRWWRE